MSPQLQLEPPETRRVWNLLERQASRDTVLLWAAAVVALVGAWLRIVPAYRLGLNADEALQVTLSYRNSFAEALQGALSVYHPPLLMLLEYWLKSIVLTELGARLIPVVAGALVPVVVFLWLRRRCGIEGAFVAMTLLAFGPRMISVSAQLRSYSLPMLLAALTLLWLDEGIDFGSTVRMALAGVSLWLAVLSDFSVALICPAIALYGFQRLWEKRPARTIWIAWGVALAVAFSLYVLIYFMQVHALLWRREYFAQTWLRGGFRAPGEFLPLFVVRATMKQFAYMAASIPVSVALVAVFAAGLAAARRWALLLTVPFACGVVASVLRVFPYARTRHTSILGLFIAVGIALAVQHWAKGRRIAILVAALIAVPIWLGTAAPDPEDRPAQALDRHAFRAAVSFLQQAAPPPSTVFATVEAWLTLKYYVLATPGAIRLEAEPLVFRFADPAEFQRELERFRQRNRLDPEASIWVADAADPSIARDLSPVLHRFSSISVFRQPVEPGR